MKKMKFAQLTAALAVCGLLSFPSYGQGGHDHGKMKGHGKMEKKEGKEKSKEKVSEQTKKNLRAVLKANENLHNAFFNYEGEKVEKAAKNLKAAMEEVKDPKIAKLLVFSKKKLGEIEASAKREANNQNYHLVSMALIHLVNTYDLGEEYKAYSCPMVQKKWIQNTAKKEKVHNPYAPSMPHCGGMEG